MSRCGVAAEAWEAEPYAVEVMLIEVLSLRKIGQRKLIGGRWMTVRQGWGLGERRISCVHGSHSAVLMMHNDDA